MAIIIIIVAISCIIIVLLYCKHIKKQSDKYTFDRTSNPEQDKFENILMLVNFCIVNVLIINFKRPIQSSTAHTNGDDPTSQRHLLHDEVHVNAFRFLDANIILYSGKILISQKRDQQKAKFKNLNLDLLNLTYFMDSRLPAKPSEL